MAGVECKFRECLCDLFRVFAVPLPAFATSSHSVDFFRRGAVADARLGLA